MQAINFKNVTWVRSDMCNSLVSLTLGHRLAADAYLRFVPGTTGSAGVKIFSLLCFGVKILNLVYFGVKRSEISELMLMLIIDGHSPDFLMRIQKIQNPKNHLF